MKQKLKTMALAWAFTPCLAFATTWYVDGTNGSDDNAGSSKDHAKATIQAAIDASVDNDTILVAPGTYSPIVATNIAIVIRSTAGAWATCIDGHKTDRCALFDTADPANPNSLPRTTLDGFTLRNGYRDGYANDGAGAAGGIIQNCVITGCTGWSSALAWCYADNCLAYGNNARCFGTLSWVFVNNCTVVDNEGYACWDCVATNSILMTGDIYTSAGDPDKYHHCLTMVQHTEEYGNITGDPHFVDATHGDYRLAADSPCIDSGDNSYVVGERDFDGSERIVNGRVDIGCYEYGSVGGPYVEKVGETNWTYMIKNGKASVGDGVGAAVTNTIAGAVDVPTVLRGRPVTAIDHAAFLDCGEMTSVTIPAGVKEIGSEAFSGCEKLANVWFEGDAIGKIGRHAFLGCYWDLIMHVPADWQGRGRTIAGYTVWRGGSSDVEKCVNVTVTNVVVQYVLNSIQPQIATPTSETGFVNIITEVESSGAVSVPTEWKNNYSQFETKFGSDFGKALSMKTGKKDGAGNDMLVWQDFVTGTDPTDENDVFTASITIVDGVPVISYTPELTPEQANLRVYKTFGKTKLSETSWTDISNKSSEERANYNFFKVTVEMK